MFASPLVTVETQAWLGDKTKLLNDDEILISIYRKNISSGAEIIILLVY